MSPMHNETGEKPLTIQELAENTKRRVEDIAEEFRQGFEFIMNYPKSVTFFGSTKSKPEDFYYQKAEKLAGMIVRKLHYSVITGGGPGIMEAANKGAYEAGGNSLGLTIELPQGQLTNRYVTSTVGFHHFFSRKVCLSFCAEAYIFLPGGFGTLDEFTEILTLVQTGKIRRVPIVLVGLEYWKPILQFFKDTLLKEKMVDAEDLDLFTLTDDEEEIMEIVSKSPVEIMNNRNLATPQGGSKSKSVAEGPLNRFFRW